MAKYIHWQWNGFALSASQHSNERWFEQFQGLCDFPTFSLKMTHCLRSINDSVTFVRYKFLDQLFILTPNINCSHGQNSSHLTKQNQIDTRFQNKKIVNKKNLSNFLKNLNKNTEKTWMILKTELLICYHTFSSITQTVGLFFRFKFCNCRIFKWIWLLIVQLLKTT